MALSEDVEAFMKNGGSVQQVPMGVTGITGKLPFMLSGGEAKAKKKYLRAQSSYRKEEDKKALRRVF